MPVQTSCVPGGESLTGSDVERAEERPIRVVVITDNRFARDRLSTLIEEVDLFEMVAAADGFTSGLVHIRELKPEVALVDAALCQCDTAHNWAPVRDMAPHAAVVMMNVTPTGAELLGMIEAGATGFVVRDATVDDLVGTIRTVAKGKAVLPDVLIPALWSSIAAGPLGVDPPKPTPAEVSLTLRERQVALLVGEGCANKEIARRLNIATHTVKSHLHHILKKLELPTRLQLAASQAGWSRQDRR